MYLHQSGLKTRSVPTNTTKMPCGTMSRMRITQYTRLKLWDVMCPEIRRLISVPTSSHFRFPFSVTEKKNGDVVVSRFFHSNASLLPFLIRLFFFLIYNVHHFTLPLHFYWDLWPLNASPASSVPCLCLLSSAKDFHLSLFFPFLKKKSPVTGFIFSEKAGIGRIFAFLHCLHKINTQVYVHV